MTEVLGRPTKFTEETIQDVLHAISLGSPYELACDYAGISYELFRQWHRRAENGEEVFIVFVDRVKKAQGVAAVKWLTKIDKAMEEQWQAAAWKLERRHNKYFSSQTAVLELNERLDKLEQSKKDEEK